MGRSPPPGSLCQAAQSETLAAHGQALAAQSETLAEILRRVSGDG